MNKNPFINALLAAGYIVIIVRVMTLFTDNPSGGAQVPSLLIPMVMLSLFTLSAAVMGYLFVYEPGRLYLEGKKQEALKFFFSTVGTFAVITAALVTTLLFALRM